MNSDQTFLINFFKQTNHIPDNIAREIGGYFEEVSFKKNDLILKQGKINDAYIFLEQGFARAYTHDTEGNEVTTNFFTSGSVVFEVASFFKRTPTQENIQALEDCMGWQVSFERLNYLFHTMPEFRDFGRMILVNGFTALKERMLSMITCTAEERYDMESCSAGLITQYCSDSSTVVTNAYPTVRS